MKGKGWIITGVVLGLIAAVGILLLLMAGSCGPTRTKSAPALDVRATAESMAATSVAATLTAEPTQTPVIKQVVATPTPLPPTNTPKPAAASPTPTITPTATPTLVPTKCEKHGQIAWQNDNRLDKGRYGVAPVGGLDEPCAIVGQTWTDLSKTERFVFYVSPHSVMWIKDHRGGTGWYFDPASHDVQANLEEQAGQLLDRDGPMPTYLVELPAKTFRLVTRIQPEPSVAPSLAQPDPRYNPVGKPGKCNIGGVSTGPAILEGNVDGLPTVIKLTASYTFTLTSPAGCWAFPSQDALDRQWPIHTPGFLARYPVGNPQGQGRAIER